MRATLLCLALAGCGVQDVGGGAGFDFFGLTGEVFLCSASPPPPGWPEVGAELCWRDGDAGELEQSIEEATGSTASCVPTPRHFGPCLYGCEPHTGCNAYQGCWCP